MILTSSAAIHCIRTRQREEITTILRRIPASTYKLIATIPRAFLKTSVIVSEEKAHLLIAPQQSNEVIHLLSRKLELERSFGIILRMLPTAKMQLSPSILIICEESLIDFDIEEAKKEKSEQGQQAEIITALQEKFTQTECPDEEKKALNRVIKKNWSSMSKLQPLDVEELDQTRQYPKVKAKRLALTEKQALERQQEMMVRLRNICEETRRKLHQHSLPKKATTGNWSIVTDIRNNNRISRDSPLQMPCLQKKLLFLRGAKVVTW